MMSGFLDMVEKNHSRFLVGNRELGLCLMTFCIFGVALLSYVTKFFHFLPMLCARFDLFFLSNFIPETGHY